MKLDKITQNLLAQISDLHDSDNGAISLRKNGKGEIVRSTKNIEITKKEDCEGIDVYVRSKCQNESCHIPVVVTAEDFHDITYNDFYIEDGAVVTIVAGCGIHSNGDSSHDGIHTFHIGKNAKVMYYENHLALGEGVGKNLNPITKIELGEGATMIINTTQIGGVDYSNRKTQAKLKTNAVLEVNEKVLTDRFNVAKTDFKVVLDGKNSKCKVTR